MSLRLVARSILAIGLIASVTACGGDKPADSADTTSADTAPMAGSEPAATLSEAGTRGQAIYASNCIACHQANGQGMPGAFPPLAGSEWVTGSVDRPVAILLHGLQGPITVAGTEYNGVMMAGGTLGAMSDDQIADVLTYVRASFGNSAAEISPADVARVRAEHSARTTPWTAAELQALP